LTIITGAQLRAARGLLGWAQEDLARKAKVAIGTIRRMEDFDGRIGSRTTTLAKVIATLERSGIEFLNESGVKLRKNL
jgi:predicted transcriptional regulator